MYLPYPTYKRLVCITLRQVGTDHDGKSPSRLHPNTRTSSPLRDANHTSPGKMVVILQSCSVPPTVSFKSVHSPSALAMQMRRKVPTVKATSYVIRNECRNAVMSLPPIDIDHYHSVTLTGPRRCLPLGCLLRS